MKLIKVGDINLNYEDAGKGSTVIFIHGIPTDYRAWGPMVKGFADSYRTVVYSRRCAFPNRSKDTDSSTVENNVKDLAGLMKAIDAGPVHLIGHSYGGFVALYQALTDPTSVRSLVLIEPYVPTMVVKDPQSSLQMFGFLLSKPSLAMATRKFLKESQGPALKELEKGDNEKALQLFIDGVQTKQGSFDNLPKTVRSMMKDDSKTMNELTTKLPVFTRKEASTIKAPTLLIKGEKGLDIHEEVAQRLHQSIPQNELVRILGSAHFPHMEKPDDCRTKILEFLAKQG
jgi:pimeloyl-ACP methyl ester carboxylesterase